ncbi:lysophospholipid acyltransferase family protein [uncultured Thalassolituus sp.]|uniref:lysophospholipid acyltransferase family protein n=1 Tax=uncultured Thalassolituus sp. TaxID=285273 RepID=UPI0026280A9A|nr:lysophospholipid acyltransferase family protein [uncultured Thalassolituus sp.]
MKNLVGYLMIGLIKTLGYISLADAQRLGRIVGRLMWMRRTRSREVARVNLDLCYPQLSDAERTQLLRDTLFQNGMTGAEMGPMWGYEPDKISGMIRQVHNEALFDRLLAEDKGLLLMVPHLGNWEIISTYAARKCSITAMYRPAKIRSFSDWMVRRREAVGAKMVPTTGGGVKRLFTGLMDKEVIGFLPDQEPRKKNGIFAPFMGIPTLTPVLPHQMIQKTGCNVIFAFSERLPDAEGFDIHFVAAEEGQYSTDPLEAATAMNRAIETCVSQCPAQYQWTYKRFKRRPDGARNPYRAAGVP